MPTAPLVSSPARRLPSYDIVFHLYARDNCKTMAAVLAQTHGNNRRPVAYFSKVLPVPVQGMPACLRALAASAMAVEDSMSVILGHKTIRQITHHELRFLKNLTTQHVTAQRASGYEAILTSTTNLEDNYAGSNSGPITMLNCLLGIKGETDNPPEEQGCGHIMHEDTAPRIDMQENPIPEALDIFVDDSCSRPSAYTFLTGYAVAQLPDIVHEAQPLPYMSA